MNDAVASLVTLILVAAVGAPLLWPVLRPGEGAMKLAAVWTLGVASFVALPQSGLLAPRVPSWVTIEAVQPGQPDKKACTELIQALRQYGVLLEEPRPGAIVANEERWRQIPSNIQDVVALCAERDGEPAVVTFGR